MSTRDNKALVGRFFEEAWNKGDYALLDKLYSPDYKLHILWHNVAAGGLVEVQGIERAAKVLRGWREGFPDMTVSIEDQVAEGDLVASRLASRLTHTGPFQGLPPTGKSALITGTTLDRIADGRIVESWANWDVLGLMKQLGVAGGPPPGGRPPGR